MKELTIEEKAARYDLAIEVAKKYYNGILEDIMEIIFPELEESEDERIRKELIDFLKEEEAKADITSKRSETLCKYIDWLEKQGEQKETLCDKCRKEQPSHSCQDITALGRCAVEHKQKPTDEVRPKFKIGDWVVSPNGVYWHIDAINNNRYEVSSTDGTGADWPFNTSLYHLWTIQDAKDGDVLSYRDGQWCFIYKGIVTEDTFKYYALLSEKGITVNDAAFSLLSSCITPATKEQREQLEKAMADVGYTFDFEEKKLKELKKHR